MSTKLVRPFEAVLHVPATKKGESSEGLENVQHFLARFGYLEEGKYTPDELDEPTSEALTKYQKFYKLRPTGNFTKATAEQMATGRCGLPDLRLGIEFATTCAWQKFNLTFAFDTGTNDVAGNAEFQAVRNAFQTWAAVVPLTFTEVTINQNPDIRIGWRPANDPDHSMVGGVLAHADFPPGCSVIVNNLPLPLHFDDTEHVWVIGAAANAFDVETVALHEIGHLLGMAHSNVAGSVMFPSVSSNFTKRALTADDISGVQSIYPLVVRVGDSNDQAGGVSEIATIKHQTQQVVTAVRTESNTLKLISWQVNGDGSLTRTGDSGDLAGTASNIDIAKGSKYVTACRTSSGNLKLISWNITNAGAITRAGDSGNQAGTASRIKIAALSDSLFVAACRTADGSMKLISWRLNNDGSLTRLNDSGNAAGTVSEVWLTVLSTSNGGGRVVTSVRDGAGDLKLIVWNITAAGAISRLGDSGSQAGAATMIRAVKDASGRIVTAVRAGNSKLKLISWSVSANGNTVTRLADSGDQAGQIGDNALMDRPNGVLSAVRTQDGSLKLIAWTVTAGAITRVGDSGSQAGIASRITLCQDALSGNAPIVTAVRTEANNLKLISWRV